LVPVTRRISGLLQGDYSGLLHRAGSELGDTRKYLEGDDVRRIDWPATARTGETQVHDTIADHELEAWFVVDASASMRFGTAQLTKLELAEQVVGALGHLICQTGNRVGCVVTGSHGGHVMPRAGLDQLASVIAAVDRASRDVGQSQESVGAGDAMSMPLSPAARRGLVVVISDFLDSEWFAELKRARQKHDVIAVAVSDPREHDMPNVGVVEFADAETGVTVVVDTSDSEWRREFRESAARRQFDLLERLRATRADVVQLTTDSDWVEVLAGFLRTRKRRLAAGAGR
jgi:uncharacterized protein (DUF58 family)